MEVNASAENPVLIPFCFTTEGKKEGQSGANFTLKIAIQGTNITRTISGGVTASKIVDFDSNPIPKSPRQVINSQADIFDIAFSKPAYFGLPNEVVNIKLSIQSYSDITLNLSIESDANVSLSQKFVHLSAGQPVIDIELGAQAGIGSWPIAVRADVIECPICSKQAETMLYINESIPEQTGWTASLFPKSLDVESGQTVDIKVTITNNGPMADFNISLITALPYTISQNLVVVQSGSSIDIPGQITLPNEEGVYSIQVRVSSGNITKTDSLTISVKETDFDIKRQAEDIKSQNPELSQSVDSSLGKWSSSSQSLKDYQDVIADLQSQSQPQIEQEQKREERANNWWILPVIVVIVIAILIVAILKVKRSHYSMPIEPLI
jgi:hypothetical protein